MAEPRLHAWDAASLAMHKLASAARAADAQPQPAVRHLGVEAL